MSGGAAPAAVDVGDPAINISIFAGFVAIPLVALALAVAASANLPTIVYSLFWGRFTTRGALWSICGGLVSTIVLIIFSPVVSGKVDPVTGASLSMITDTSIDFSFFPLPNPGIVSIPLAFLLGWIGTMTSRPERDHDGMYDEMEVRALTGAGSEKAVDH